ncbi:transglycosylase domain-containing protein [Salinimicrobium sp. TH3]|uniref:transglycosylase domain-containing protein n=1 Tax=Salinimicrobium sp. TH3 TaxID=2997342 RepID=UPI0022750A0F|nr:transglycosylase domain-containing protein [Salinimicrobium sp. TH3]MCY2685920.1 transglycosylase domain-containing protein [Salinimicrobium sp. TH3]
MEDIQTQFDGYTVYFGDRKIKFPLGVISSNHECRARSNFFPAKLSAYTVYIEDRKFYDHSGIDFKGIVRAAKTNFIKGRIVQGGSTITQQLARNLINDNTKTFKRKIKEVIRAFDIEGSYSKNDILNLYFNNIYFGKNLRGVRAAGLFYFGKDVNELSQVECLYLLTIIRGPNYYLTNPEQKNKRFLFLNEVLYNKGLISDNLYRKNLKSTTNFGENSLQVFTDTVVPFIANGISTKGCKIFTSLNKDLQEIVETFRRDSKYPVSIIAIRREKVVAFSSSYGSDYPFKSRANVGSTLKPFLYCFLRNSGIPKEKRFDAVKNNLNWKVREYYKNNSTLNLEEALYLSNNNTFINACDQIGIDKPLSELARVLKKERTSMTESIILGATNPGITLFELATAYAQYFKPQNLTPIKKECLAILNRVATDKLGFNVENAFLKTGTTNANKERYAIIGNAEMTFAILRNENPIDDSSKEGGFIKQISKAVYAMLVTKKNYKWS